MKMYWTVLVRGSMDGRSQIPQDREFTISAKSYDLHQALNHTEELELGRCQATLTNPSLRGRFQYVLVECDVTKEFGLELFNVAFPLRADLNNEIRKLVLNGQVVESLEEQEHQRMVEISESGRCCDLA